MLASNLIGLSIQEQQNLLQGKLGNVPRTTGDSQCFLFIVFPPIHVSVSLSSSQITFVGLSLGVSTEKASINASNSPQCCGFGVGKTLVWRNCMDVSVPQQIFDLVRSTDRDE